MAHGINLTKLRRRIVKEGINRTGQEVAEAARGTGLRMYFRLNDCEYLSLPQDVWDDVVRHLGIHRVPYKANKKDCDDFACAFKGRAAIELEANGAGMVCDDSAGHAYAIVLTHRANDPSFFNLLEPQADRPDGPNGWWKEIGDKNFKGLKGFVLL